jgi:hypothetical protein
VIELPDEVLGLWVTKPRTKCLGSLHGVESFLQKGKACVSVLIQDQYFKWKIYRHLVWPVCRCIRIILESWRAHEERIQRGKEAFGYENCSNYKTWIVTLSILIIICAIITHMRFKKSPLIIKKANTWFKTFPARQ